MTIIQDYVLKLYNLCLDNRIIIPDTVSDSTFLVWVTPIGPKTGFVRQREEEIRIKKVTKAEKENVQLMGGPKITELGSKAEEQIFTC